MKPEDIEAANAMLIRLRHISTAIARISVGLEEEGSGMKDYLMPIRAGRGEDIEVSALDFGKFLIGQAREMHERMERITVNMPPLRTWLASFGVNANLFGIVEPAHNSEEIAQAFDEVRDEVRNECASSPPS